MSDSWYRQPFDLPPFLNDFGNLYYMDGRVQWADGWEQIDEEHVWTEEEFLQWIDDEILKKFQEKLRGLWSAS